MMATILRWLLTASLLGSVFEVAAHDANSGRGAFSPSVPVSMDYELPDVIPQSGAFDLPVTVSTPLESGRIVVELLDSKGLSLVSGGNGRYFLHANEHSFEHRFCLTLAADDERYIVVSVTVDGLLGPLSRTYRIDFPLADTEGAQQGVKASTRRTQSTPAFEFLPAGPQH